MDDLTISCNSSFHDRIEPERLAALIGSRLCHDLISPLGAIGNGLELLQMSGALDALADSPELALIAESVEASRARIRWFRMAFGHAAEDQRCGMAEMAGLLRDFEKGGRIRARIDAQGDLPRAEGRLILLGLMCLETALPWGGSVLICRGASGWRLVAEATRTRIDPELWAWLDPDGSQRLAQPAPGPAPGDVHFAMLAGCAARAGRALSWELDGQGGEISF